MTPPSKLGWLTSILANKTRLSLAIMFAFFALYLSTLPHTNVGYADSDEFLSVGYHLGVAHPPGYPLYVLLLNLFMHLPLPLSLAARGHFLSVLLSVLTLGLLTQLIFVFIQDLNRTKKSQKPISPGFVSLLTVSMIGLNPLFWLYAIITEKVAFSAFIASLTLTLIYASLKSRRFIFFAFLSLGVAVGHHPLLTGLLLPLIYSIWLNRSSFTPKHATRWLVGFLLALFVPLLLLLPINQRQVPVSWHFEATLPGFWQHITRAAFYGENYAKNQEVGSVFSNLDVNQGFNAISKQLIYFWQTFGIYTLLLALILAARWYRKIISLDIFVLSAFVGLGPVVAFLLRYPEDWGTQGILLRQWYPALIPLTLVLSLGWYETLLRLRGFFSLLFPRLLALTLFLTLPLVLVFSFGSSSYTNLDFSHNTLIYDRYNLVLNQLPPSSLLTCFSDVSCFALLYQQSVLKSRPDIDIIPVHINLVTDTLNKPDLMGFNYPGNPYLMADIISWNLDRRPVYAIELNSYFYQLLGVDVPFLYYVPEGYLGRLTKKLPESLPQPPDYALSERFRELPTNPFDPYRTFQKTIPARDHILNAQMYLKMDQRNHARAELNQSANIYKSINKTDSDEFQKLRVQLEQGQPAKSYALGSSSPDAKTLLGYIPQLLEKDFLSRALRVAQGSILVEPKNPATHFALAQLYEKIGENNFAYIEYLNTQTLDVNYEGLSEQLAKFNVVQ